MSTTRTIIGLGEALFDLFPDGPLLGGAPLNVAVHAQQLGNGGVVVSRVGQDDLGKRVTDELVRRGMTTEFVQTDPDRPTGTVVVDLDERGEPTYTITPSVAWDALQFDPDMENLAKRCDAVCYGTLAQRDGQARNTIYRFLETAKQAVRLFDVNLRQNYYDRRILQRSVELASAVKLNADELKTLSGVFSLAGEGDAAVAGVFKRFPHLKWVAVTNGKEGTEIHTPTYKHRGTVVGAKEGGDAVGAGDAAAAALLHGAVRRWAWDRTLVLANTLGAFVASCKGACPPVGEEIRKIAG